MSVKEILKNSKLFDKIAQQTFDAVDTDGSGLVSEDELFIILSSIANDLGYEKPTEEDTKNILKEIDVDKSGAIDFNEFKDLFRRILNIINEHT